ncbi:hypothetical protein ACFO5R_09765 [Halosolutus amylolyticus]|uniref:Uncharacterized protein n=1 Tax=Halosolutus amylolyticus TaxID=2932267 RepID=A0ABD5PP42_9EURY|nr:hypothetical protein [Halosolutus amylolyticus]
MSAIPIVAGTASASETNDGYGVGGYGTTAYGGTQDGTDGTGNEEPTEDAPLENTILFDGVGTTGESLYEFTVTGDVEQSTYGGASVSDADTIDGGRVTGTVTGWRDAYRFSGDLEELTVDGQARVSVNGERVDPAEYGSEQSHVVTIVGNGTHSEYDLATDGSIEVLEGDDATVVSGGRAKGTIERDVHRYQLSGKLVEFTFREGGTHVYLDDQRIDPEDYTGEVTLPHAIVFDGTDASSQSRYSFTIDGDVSKSEYRDASIDRADTIDDSTVEGFVDAGAVDAYWFDGTIADFKLSGTAEVDVEYDVRPR